MLDVAHHLALPCLTLVAAVYAQYLLADAFRADAGTFVVVSNDSDLMEPIRLVSQELGYRVAS